MFHVCLYFGVVYGVEVQCGICLGIATYIYVARTVLYHSHIIMLLFATARSVVKSVKVPGVEVV